jgi:hypothetical protein
LKILQAPQRNNCLASPIAPHHSQVNCSAARAAAAATEEVLVIDDDDDDEEENEEIFGKEGTDKLVDDGE